MLLFSKLVLFLGKHSLLKVQRQKSYSRLINIFGGSYPDPVTTESQQVHRCWVVTNGRITKEALTSMQSALSSQNLNLLTYFVNGDELWQKVLIFLKNHTVLQRLFRSR